MPAVKRRRYDSTLRREQASQTRMRILDAAERLFRERGYAATTVEAIASAAGVATDTVYASFRSKGGILHRLLDVRVGGDDQPVPLLEREGPRAVREERDRGRQLQRFASDIGGILERARPVDDIMRGAAEADPEIRRLRARMQRTRRQNIGQFVGWLAAKGPFRGGLGPDEATDIVWTLAGPEVHGLLRRDRGWSQDRYAAWLAETLKRTLL